MNNPGALMQGVSLMTLLLLLRLSCRRARLAPTPLRLPCLALLIWVIHTNLPAALLNGPHQRWFELILQLSRGYAGIQLLLWLTLELPAPIRWWPHPPKILRDLAALSAGSVLTLVALQQAARINVIGLITTSAILAAVVGLAAQEVLKDLFAGIMLRLDGAFIEGDFLAINKDLNGWVESFSLLSTRLRHGHGGLITLTNSILRQQNLRRFAPAGPIARELHIHLDRELPPDRATALLMQVAEQSTIALKEPAPNATVHAYHEYAITYELEVWQSDPSDRGFDDLRGELLAQLWYVLERNGQRVPYPVQEFRRRVPGSPPEHLRNYNIEERIAILRQCSLFSHLSEEQLTEVSTLTRCIRFGAGEKIVIEQQAGDTMYQIVSGRVDVLKTTPDGGQQTVAQLCAPGFFGEMSVFNGEVRSATVRAVEACVLLEIEREDLRPVLEQHPESLERLARIVSERRAELLNLTAESSSKQGGDLMRQMRRLFLGA